MDKSEDSLYMSEGVAMSDPGLISIKKMVILFLRLLPHAWDFIISDL